MEYTVCAEPLYKIVGPAGECLNGGRGSWPLPVDGKPGEWWEIAGPLEACRNGLHLATAAQLPNWLNAGYAGRDAVVYRVETDGPLVDHGDKWVAGKVRLLPRSRPMPDLAAARAVRNAAYDRARKRHERAEKRATILLDVAVPAQWRTYLSKIGRDKLPAGHPGAAYQVALADAQAAYDAAIAPVIAAGRAAQRRADAAYARALTDARLPE